MALLSGMSVKRAVMFVGTAALSVAALKFLGGAIPALKNIPVLGKAFE